MTGYFPRVPQLSPPYIPRIERYRHSPGKWRKDYFPQLCDDNPPPHTHTLGLAHTKIFTKKGKNLGSRERQNCSHNNKQQNKKFAKMLNMCYISSLLYLTPKFKNFAQTQHSCHSIFFNFAQTQHSCHSIFSKFVKTQHPSHSIFSNFVKTQHSGHSIFSYFLKTQHSWHSIFSNFVKTQHSLHSIFSNCALYQHL